MKIIFTLFGIVTFSVVLFSSLTTIFIDAQDPTEEEGYTPPPDYLWKILNSSTKENTILPWAEASTDLDEWEAPLYIRQNYPYYLSGYDEEGRPIWIAEIGKWNFREAVEKGGDTIRDLAKYMEQGAYRIIKARADKGTPDAPVTDSILIGDADQFQLSQVTHIPTVTFLLNWASKYQKAITGHLHVCLVLNTNSIALTIVNLLKPVFGGVVERAEIYGTNRNNWVNRVLKYCPKDQIPPWYGGSKDYAPVRVYG